MSVIGERQVTGGNGRESFRSESVDKLRIGKVFGSVINFGSGQIASPNRLIGQLI
jgi:hypothetical protein